MPSALLGRVLRGAALILAALAISALAVIAGRWQFSRHETRSHTLHAYEAAEGAPPAPLALLDPPGTDALPEASQWRLASTSGQFEQDSLTVLRNRAVDGVRVSEYLAWFITDDGQALLLMTGYVPLEAGTAAPALPPGRLDLVVQLRVQEPDDGKRGDGATRVVAAQMPDAPGPTLAGFGVLRGDCDAACEATFGAQVPDPKLSLGPHLAYTFQWYALAVIAPVGAVLLLVRRRTDDDEPGAPREEPRAGRKRRPRGPSDEEIEDAL